MIIYINKMKIFVVLLLLAVANEALSRRVNSKLGRRLTAPATMRANNMHYNLTVSNMADLAAAGNPVCGWPWVGANNQVWDVQLHPDNGAYNASAMNKWTFRTMSGGGHHYFYLAATRTGGRRNLSIEAWRADDSVIWEYAASSHAFRNKEHGKIDFGNGYAQGTTAKCDGNRSNAWNDRERFEVKWVHADRASHWVDS